MNLKEQFDQENDVPKSITPLDNDEIKSILKIQSEAIFKDKNLSNNSNFIKKTLIDIALDFKSRESNNQSLENTDKIKEVDTIAEKNENIEEISSEHSNQIEKNVKGSTTNEINETDELGQLSNQSSGEPEFIHQKDDQINTTSIDLNTENNQSENTKESDLENIKSQNQDEIDGNEINLEPNINIDETQQALDSVRDAVSQSINKSDNENGNITNENKEVQNDVYNTISKDFDQFKNIFSSLSNLGEDAIYEAIQSKIIDIAYELAGYQIDKMPEKYEKKIRALLKNINCFEDKMKIEVNEQDYDALSKIENLFDTQDKSIFISNKDLSRGDIILNCDGMHYSEKSNKTL